MSRNKSLPNRYGSLKGCVERRTQMIEEGRFSLSPQEGRSIILTSGQTREDRETLAEHADKLASDVFRVFLSAEIIRQPVVEDVEDVIIDPEVTNIAFLGDGTFSSFNMLHGSRQNESLSWYNLARMATHLKQGVVELRTCSAIRSPEKETRVSLPAFIVADQTKIVGTVDKIFANHHGFEEFNYFLSPVYTNPSNTAEELRRPIGFELPL